MRKSERKSQGEENKIVKKKNSINSVIAMIDGVGIGGEVIL